MAVQKPLKIDTADGGIKQMSSTDTIPNIIKRTITVENPSASEKIAILYTTQALTILKVHAVVKGSSPSVTYNIAYGTDISAAGTNVTTTPSAVTNTTTGVDATLNNVAVPTSGWVWLITTAVSGTVTWLAVTIEF